MARFFQGVRGMPLFLIVMLAFSAFAAPALGQSTVAIGELQGVGAHRVRRVAADAVHQAPEWALVPADDRPAWVIDGRIRGRGRRARVRLTLREVDGVATARRVIPLRRARSLRQGLGALLRAGRTARSAARQESPPAEACPRLRSLATSASDTARRSSAQLDDERPSRPFFEARVGARIAGRLAAVGTEAGDIHRNAVHYPELTAEVTTRPFEDASGLERGLVLRAFFAHAVGLRSRNGLTDEAVSTSFFRASGDVALFFDLGEAIELGLGLGFGWDAFLLGQQEVVVMPSAEYGYLRPHVGGRVPLEGELLVLELELAYRGVLTRGSLSRHFGREGETQGIDAMLRLGGSLDLGLSYGLEAGVVSYFHFFGGEAVTAAGRNGQDLGLWLGARFGFAIR